MSTEENKEIIPLNSVRFNFIHYLDLLGKISQLNSNLATNQINEAYFIVDKEMRYIKCAAHLVQSVQYEDYNTGIDGVEKLAKMIYAYDTKGEHKELFEKDKHTIDAYML